MIDNDAIGDMVEATKELMRHLCAPKDVRKMESAGWSPALWGALSELGVPLVGIDEKSGGLGGSIADVCALLEVAGAFAAPLPIAETAMLGGWAMAAAGLALPEGGATVGPEHVDNVVHLERRAGGWSLQCRLHRVPWASKSDVTVLLAREASFPGNPLYVLALDRLWLEIEPGRNLAGELRESVRFDGRVPEEAIALAPAGVNEEVMRFRGALSRCALMCGALLRVCTLTQSYAGVRQQFGRPVGRFQAVQRHLVKMVEQTQAAKLATRVAAHNSVISPDLFGIAAAKVVAGEASTAVSSAAHQTHGAIGMTADYELAQLTRRLWTWRDEYHSELFWSRYVGRQVTASGAQNLWLRVSTGMAEPS